MRNADYSQCRKRICVIYKRATVAWLYVDQTVSAFFYSICGNDRKY